MSQTSRKKPRKQPWQPGRVPRPFEIWLESIFRGERWTHDGSIAADWFTRVQKLVQERNCALIVDSARHWRESVYMYDYPGRGPTILAGAARNPKYACTAILHELGHHILRMERRNPAQITREEEMAWEIAIDLAQKERLPFYSQLKRNGLYSYRLAKLREEQSGSKRRTRARPLPKSWRLEDSKRSSAADFRLGQYSTGKRGKRHAKRFVKRVTSKAERRRPVPEE